MNQSSRTRTGVHGDEEAAAGLECHLLRVAGKLEGLEASLLGVLDGQDLLRHHGEDGEEDAVELVEAAPEPALRVCMCARGVGGLGA